MADAQIIKLPEFKAELVRYDITAEDIRAMREKYAACTFDTPTNYEEGRKAIQVCRETRGRVEKRRKELKAGLLEAGRQIDSVAAEFIEALESIENPLKLAKGKVDDEKERIKREKAEAEKKALE